MFKSWVKIISSGYTKYSIDEHKPPGFPLAEEVQTGSVKLSLYGNCAKKLPGTFDLKTDWFCMQGVEKSQLAEDMDWLISELKVRQRDVGFTGEPEEVIHYASLLLGENLVTRFVGRTNFIVNETRKIMQTEMYQNE